MSDLKNSQIMYLKGWLFLGIVIISTILILVECPSWKVGGLLVLEILHQTIVVSRRVEKAIKRFIHSMLIQHKNC